MTSFPAFPIKAGFINHLNEGRIKMSLITISGGAGCGAEKIAHLLAERAKIELYDDTRLQEEAVKMGVRSQDLKGLDEKSPGFFDVLRGNRPELYVDLMESVIYSVSRSGNGIILGHGSQILLRDFGCALHIFIHASDPYRIQTLMEQRGLSRKAAEKMIAKTDHERRGFLRFAFHMEWNDPSLYDLVINTEKLGVDGAVNLILDALKNQTVQECSLSALESIEKMSLTKKVEAALLKENFSFTQFHVEVPEKGVVQIYGYASTTDDKKRLVDKAAKVSGVTKLIDEVGVMPPGGY
jgi:cytidylate kinase